MVQRYDYYLKIQSFGRFLWYIMEELMQIVFSNVQVLLKHGKGISRLPHGYLAVV